MNFEDVLTFIIENRIAFFIFCKAMRFSKVSKIVLEKIFEQMWLPRQARSLKLVFYYIERKMENVIQHILLL